MRIFNARKSSPRLAIAAFAVMALLLSACDYLPQDPENTTQTIRETGVLKVALLENAPWVTDVDKPDGVEVRLIEAFAKTLDAEAEWYRMGEEEAFRALEADQVHLVIGGLVKSTPRKAGLTRSYYTTTYSVGWPHAGAGEIKEQIVALTPGNWLAKKVREKGGKLLESPEPFNTQYPVAAADWELVRHGYYPGVTLDKIKHVMAVQQGENRFLIALEKFLESRKDEIAILLEEFNPS